MRLLGFDVYFESALSDKEIIEISKGENRIILTKSKKLLKFRDVSHGIFIRPGTTAEQVKRIVDHLNIKDQVKPFSRCLRCNSLIEPVSKKEIVDRIPPRTKTFCDEYSQCKSCDKIYWDGTHFINLKKVIDHILGNLEPK